MSAYSADAVADVVRGYLQQCRTPPLRTMLEWAEQEIVIPEGPHAGRRYRGDVLPWTAEFLRAADDPGWREVWLTGPAQGSKTTTGSNIPTLYHLFEMRETVIFAMPTDDMIGDKWTRDLRPMIEAGRYAEHIPKKGISRLRKIQFGNGATLRFMTGAGADKSRAGYTSRVVVITEADGLDNRAATSSEADKISQLKARVRAFGGGEQARIYAECTLTTSSGRTYREIVGGTNSRLLCPCVHCHEWVLPEREHLLGWQGHENELDAMAAAHFVCPTCGGMLDEESRAAMNTAGRIVHEGQTVTTDGKIEGDARRTTTLGFRCAGFNNLFVPARVMARDEWRAQHVANQEDAERELKLYVWALPHDTERESSQDMDWHVVARRQSDSERGIVPEGTSHVTVGIDVGMRFLHYAVVAFDRRGSGVVIDYDTLDVPSARRPVDEAVLLSLREARDLCAAGWKLGDAMVPPAVALVDSGWPPDAVYAFIAETWAAGGRTAWYPSKGYGSSRLTTQRQYYQPRTKANIVQVGEGYHISKVATSSGGLLLLDLDSDAWKSSLHNRLQMPYGEPGAVTLHRADWRDHGQFARQLTAEKRVEEWHPLRGMQVRWENARRRANHYLDACALALCAGYVAGVRTMATETTPHDTRPGVTVRYKRSDGRPFVSRRS